MTHPTTDQIEIFRAANGRIPRYTSVGSYSMIYLTESSDILCASCVNGENDSDVGHDIGIGDPEFTVRQADIYWEGDDIDCAHCGTAIESSYGPTE